MCSSPNDGERSHSGREVEHSHELKLCGVYVGPRAPKSSFSFTSMSVNSSHFVWICYSRHYLKSEDTHGVQDVLLNGYGYRTWIVILKNTTLTAHK